MKRFLALLPILALVLGLAAPVHAQTAYTATGTATTLPKTASHTVAVGAPVIASGFGAGASVLYGTTSDVFVVNVGTGGAATNGVIKLPSAAPNGWACEATDVTTPASFDERVLPTSTTTITLQNYPAGGGALVAWTAGDRVIVSCAGY